jgi:hypothetical protein
MNAPAARRSPILFPPGPLKFIKMVSDPMNFVKLSA